MSRNSSNGVLYHQYPVAFCYHRRIWGPKQNHLPQAEYQRYFWCKMPINPGKGFRYRSRASQWISKWVLLESDAEFR
ncbi:Sorbicillinoid biosynthetic cluster transcription factor 2 [Fusarium oxysporum f. sp. albedinis]|nr:Sorbicillinoid biosynthetic cluster transcription factor 2 [Fusarium oxysporum f. sp. albedinis]